MKQPYRVVSKVIGAGILVLGSLLAITGVRASSDQQPAALASCNSLDLIFLIDQSGSMSRNDPYSLRKHAVDWVIDWLGDNTLTICPNAAHLISVVSWGDTVQVDLESVVIAPQDEDEWTIQRNQLKEQVRVLNLGNTDPKAAFAVAKEIFDRATLQDNIPRKRVIFLITDGKPYIGGRGRGVPLGYNREMADQVNRDFSFDPNSGVFIWTLLMKQDEKYTQYTEDFRFYIDQITSSHGGSTFLLTENSEIPLRFQDILTQLVGAPVETVPCGQPFLMEPYLERATLGFFKLNPEVAVKISYERDGQTFTVSQADLQEKSLPISLPGFTISEYVRGSTIERYVFQRPTVGRWTIEEIGASNCQGILRAYLEPKDISAELVAPMASVPQMELPPYYDAARPVYVRYRLIDRSAGEMQTLIADQYYPITITLTLTEPNTNIKTLIMIYDSEHGIFRNEKPLEVAQAGTYRFSAYGVTNYANPAKAGPRELFRTASHSFEVFKATPFEIRILAPAPGETLTPIHGTLREGWPLPINSIDVQAQFVDLQGQPLPDLNEILTNAQAPLTAVATADGVQSETITLLPDPLTPGMYTGKITGFEVEGPQKIVVRLQSEVTELYRAANTQATVEFRRADGLLNRAATYYAILAALILAMLATIAYNIAIRTNKVAGALVFEDAGVTVAEFGLSSGKNWRDIGRRELRPYPQLGLKKLRVENRSRSARGRRRTDENDLLPENALMAQNSHPGVRVHCVTADGRAFRLELEPNLPVAYSDEAVAHMIYRPPQ